MPHSPRLLRPRQTTHPEAAAWAARVVDNGSTAGTSLAAVSKFCRAIDAAGIRDRFYRLNLFCGSNLNAALVPLYLTPDKTVTNLFQFGADQTNAAWLPGGNGLITRTATTEVGPLGYGYATKLTTPSAPFDVRQMYQQMPLDGRQVTVSAWMKTSTGTRQIQWLAGNSYSDTVTVTTTWQRFTKTFTLPTSVDARTGFATVSELSDAAGFIYVWGMQCEYGANATSYNQPRYGNTTDTNVGGLFVSANYNETGVSGGLAGNGSSKYLNTGFPTNTLSSSDRHLAAYPITWPNGGFQYFLGSESAGGIGQQQFALGHFDYADKCAFAFGPTSGSYLNNTTAISSGGMWMGVNTSGSGTIYRNGTANGTVSLAAATPTASEIYAFAVNRAASGNAANYFNGRIGGYSIGLSMTATQAAAYNTAMQAFQTALTRNV